MKTMKIRFKRPDQRAGQEVELDVAGARRAIEAGEADEVIEQEGAKASEHPAAETEHHHTAAKKATRRSK